MEEMTIKEATDFFAKFYNGEHHIPGHQPKRAGLGWYVNHNRGEISTFDFNGLTKLVVMAHDECVRVGIGPASSGHVKITIFKRKPEGDMMSRHPKLEPHIEQIRKQLVEE